MKIKNIDRVNNILEEKESLVKLEKLNLEKDLEIISNFKKILNKSYEGKELNLSEIVFELLKDFSEEKQLDILRDCGFANYIDKEKEIPEKELKLNELTKVKNIIKSKYGNEIKYGSWEGIFETIKEELKENK